MGGDGVYRIGLTGGIASGKSTVVQMLRELGAAVIDADQVAREVVEPGTAAHREIVAKFGSHMLLADGQLDRQRLAAVVFSDPEARQVINAITHPRVISRMDQMAAELAQHGYRWPIVLDIPLLIEASMQHSVDEVWLVLVDDDVQLSRLMQRNRLDESDARARIAAQWPLSSKQQWAAEIIDNNGTLVRTRMQVERSWLNAIGRAKQYAQ